MTDELKLCPFCGGDAEQDFQQSYRHMSHGNLDHAAAIYCTRCSVQMTLCRADTRELRDEERMAILVEDWNKRAPVTPPPSPDVAGVVERLAGRLRTRVSNRVDVVPEHTIEWAAATLLESLSAEKGMLEALIDSKLPCEVTVAPATRFSEGVKISTVLAATERRALTPKDGSR